jgi:hypothetical protein
MNRLIGLGIIPLVTLLACGGGGGGKTDDAGALVDGAAPSAKDALKSEVGADAPGQAPDTAIVPETDALVPVSDGAPAVDVAVLDTAILKTDGKVDVADTGLTDAKASDAVIAVDTLVKQDTTPPLPSDASVDIALPDTALDVVSVDTAVAIDTAVPVDTAISADTAVAGPDTSTVVPSLTSLTPSTGTVGQALSLTLVGTNFESTAVVQFDGQAVTTTVGSATSLTAQVPASMTAQAGSHAVLVANGAGRTSNVLYVDLVIPPGAPQILDYSPDNGVAGDTITLIGKDLATGTITITGPGGVVATPGSAGTRTWLGASVQTVTFVLPSGWQTGPIVVANANGSSRGKIFNVGKNLATLTGATVEASTEYSSAWVKARGADNDLGTSWFSANGDCATSTSCTSVPWLRVNFPTAQTISRIAVRGNREYAEGYDFIRARIDVLGASGTLWSNSYDLPDPDRDVDITLASPMTGVTSVKFTSLQDESIEPGFSELEVF